MKKTLIALLALSSVAMATNPDVMNGLLNQAILDSGYVAGDSFELSVDFTNIATVGTKTMLTLIPESLYLNSQSATWVGIGTAKDQDPSSWTQYEPTETTHSVDGNIHVYTNIMSGTGANKGWIQFGDDGKKGNAISLSNSSLTLTYDAVASCATLAYTLNPSASKRIVEELTLREVNLNATQISFNESVAFQNFQSANLVFNKIVPEPTTGALSLLALAGLCIRRRK